MTNDITNQQNVALAELRVAHVGGGLADSSHGVRLLAVTARQWGLAWPLARKPAANRLKGQLRLRKRPAGPRAGHEAAQKTAGHHGRSLGLLFQFAY